MTVRRRDLLRSCGAAAVLVSCRSVSDRSGTVATRSDDAVLDEILEELHAREPISNRGLSTHAPMVVEAMCVLGHAARAKSWFASYGGPRLELPVPHERIDPVRWRDALGPDRTHASWEAQVHRFGDWRILFEDEVRSGRWQDVVDRWAARLAPGISAAATHGVIRTAHAVRALSRSDTAPRRAELARGLAYWAAAYEELPAGATTTHAADYASALARVPLYTELHRSAPPGNIVAGLRAVAGETGFRVARDLVAQASDPASALSALTSTFARVYLQHGTRTHAVAFVHAVTAPCALRKLIPHISPATARAALPYAWQAAAAIYAAYASKDAAAARIEHTLAHDELASRAIDNGDDHAIKFTEALLAEHAIQPDAVYLAAAEDAISRLA